jgi:hypothetical protein
MNRVTYHFVRGNNPKKFATTLVNFLGKVSLLTSLSLLFGPTLQIHYIFNVYYTMIRMLCY